MLDSYGKLKQALDYHNRALAINEELKHRVEMAIDYAANGIVLGNIKRCKAASIESLSRGLL
jgi:hypothetical protein